MFYYSTFSPYSPFYLLLDLIRDYHVFNQYLSCSLFALEIEDKNTHFLAYFLIDLFEVINYTSSTVLPAFL